MRLTLRLKGLAGALGIFALAGATTLAWGAPDLAARKHPPSQAVPEPIGAIQASDRLITILATNDIHGGVEPQATKDGSPEGGMSIWSGIVSSIRQGLAAQYGDQAGVLLLDAGDQFQGTLISNYNEGQLVFAAMNRIGYDAVITGNHDYDFGPIGWLQDQVVPGWPDQDPRGALERLAQQASFPIISANTFIKASLHDANGVSAQAKSQGCASSSAIDWSQAQRPAFLAPYLLKTVAGVRVAVIGIDNTETPTTTTPANVSDLCFRDEAKSYLDTRAELEGKADVYVALIHDGNAQGETNATRFAQAIAGKVDAVISAHTHYVYNLTVGGVPVIQSGSGGTRFGRIDLFWNSSTHSLDASKTRHFAGVAISATQCAAAASSFCSPGANGAAVSYEGVPVAQDPAIDALIAQARAEVAPIASRVLGQAQGDVVTKRIDESPMADALTDALRQVSGADIAFINTGGIRAPVKAGPITYEDFFSVLPFNNHALMVGPMPAGQVLALLNRSIATCGSYGALMQSGLKVWFSRKCGSGERADPSGTKLLHVETVGGTVLLDTAKGIQPPAGQTFQVATLDFLAAGGAGYDDFKGVRVEADLGIAREAMVDWFLKDPANWLATDDGRWQQSQ